MTLTTPALEGNGSGTRAPEGVCSLLLFARKGLLSRRGPDTAAVAKGKGSDTRARESVLFNLIGILWNVLPQFIGYCILVPGIFHLPLVKVTFLYTFILTRSF